MAVGVVHTPAAPLSATSTLARREASTQALARARPDIFDGIAWVQGRAFSLDRAPGYEITDSRGYTSALHRVLGGAMVDFFIAATLKLTQSRTWALLMIASAYAGITWSSPRREYARRARCETEIRCSRSGASRRSKRRAVLPPLAARVQACAQYHSRVCCRALDIDNRVHDADSSK